MSDQQQNPLFPHPQVIFRMMCNIKTAGPDDCWPWTGAVHRDGHGYYEHTHAHRMVYQALYGPLPEEVVVRHSCDNPACCNPRHMLTGTHADNVADRVDRGRSAKGARNGRSKLTEAQAIEIINSPHTKTYLSLIYNVSSDTIKKIRQGKLWAHLERPEKAA